MKSRYALNRAASFSEVCRRGRRFSLKRGIFSLALAVAVPIGAFGQVIQNIGTLPGGANSYGMAINANGTVVVGYGNTATSGAIAFRWTPGGGIQSLGTVGGGTYSYGYAVSGDGLVAAGWGNTLTHNRGFRWTQAGGMQDLGTLPGGFDSVANGLNSDGTAIAGWATSDCCTWPRVARWTTSGGIQDLGVLPGGLFAQGKAISGDGSTVVGESNAPEAGLSYRAVRWTQSGGLQNLGTLGGNYSSAYAVSHDGMSVVGESDTGAGAIHAFRWQPAGMVDLGVLPGHFHSHARAMTGDGSVVLGWGFAPSGPSGHFLWTETFGMENLVDYLTAEGVDFSGWTLQDVNAVSANGTAIVGTGVFGGQTRAFVIRGLKPLCGPRITLVSSDQQVGCVGGTVNMLVAAFGPTFHLPAFQWERWNDSFWVPLTNNVYPSGTTVTGAFSPMLSLTNCSPLDVPGAYRCIVTAGCTSLASDVVQVSLISQAPAMDIQPTDMFICPGDSASFQAGPLTPTNAPYSYQWERETVPNSGIFVPLFNGYTYSWDGNIPGYGGIVSGAQTGTLTLAPDAPNSRVLGPPHSRNYRCVVSNACGSTVSIDAGLKAFVSCITADTNCDGLVSPGDIGPFVTALTNPAQYESLFPDCNLANADINDDGVISAGDIAPFVAILTGG